MRTIFKLIILVLVFLSLQTSLLATVQFSDITVSNLTSSSATISFFSDNSVSANIEYGTDNTSLTPTSFSTNAKFHSFQLTNLTSTTLYYFEITSGGVSYKDNGEFYSFQTAQVAIGTPYIVYGTVVDVGTSAITDAYVKLVAQQDGISSSPLSAVTDSNGKWNLNLGNLKLADTGGVMNYNVGHLIRLSILQTDNSKFTQDFSVSGSSPQALDLTVGSNSYSLPADVNVNNLFLKVNSLAGTSFDASALQTALNGATSFQDFVEALFGNTSATNLQLSQIKVAISWVKDENQSYHLPFTVEASSLAVELGISESNIEIALSQATTFTDFAIALFGTTPTSQQITQLNQAIQNATLVDITIAAKLLGFDASFNTLPLKTTLLQKALDVHTDSSGNTDYEKVAQDLEGITRSELKEKLAISQAESTFTVNLVQGLNIISLPNRPDTSLTAFSLAQQISTIDTDVSVNFVIRIDPTSQRFKAFVPSIDGSASSHNFSIQGGNGYIIKITDADSGNNPTRPLAFSGRIWVDGLTAPAAEPSGNWAFVIDSPTQLQLDHRRPTTYKLLESSPQSPATTDRQSLEIRWQGIVNQTDRLRIALVDQNRKSVVSAGDQLQLEIFDQKGQLLAFSDMNITERETKNGLIQVDFRLNPIPTATRLLPNYPNPFNPETWIPFQLHQTSVVTIQIYNSNGGQVQQIELGQLPAGLYHTMDRAAYWNGQNQIGEQVASGIYFYLLNLDDYRQTRKMVILK